MSEKMMYKTEEKTPVREKVSAAAVFLILAGVALLVVTLSGGEVMDYLWPFFVIVPGVFMLRPAYVATAKRQSRLMFLAVPGAFLTTVGSLLLVMNITDHFESWAYAWTLIPAAVIAGVMYMKRFDESHRVHEFGQKFIRAMVLAFMGFAAFFELIVFDSLGPWWPLLLVGAGIYLFMRDRQQA